MKTAFRNIIFIMVVWVYIFGSSGFTVHHCCCKKHYHVTCAIFNAYEHYVFSGCEKHTRKDQIEKTASDKDDICVVKAPKKHCADLLFTLNSEEYNSTDNLKVPASTVMELLQYLPTDTDTIFSNQYAGADVDLFLNYDTFRYRFRPRCTPNILCTFIM